MEEIKNPQRYTQKGNKMECWDFWLHYGLNPLIASAVKYVWRYKDKHGKRDLDKALVFLHKAREEAERVYYSVSCAKFPKFEEYKAMTYPQYLIIANSVLTTEAESYLLGIDNMITLINKLIGDEYDIY